MADPSISTYSAEFYENQSLGSRRSADIVVPVVKAMVEPASVVDVGCGVGTWLASWRALGVADVLGLDGSWVDSAMLQIPPACFRPHDLTRPIRLERSFDLAMSLEVAEHLEERHADGFIASLVGLAPVVLFSAAIPGQGGRHHVNEQWPDYWGDRFARHGYQPVDCVRRRVWTAPIDYCYAQNTFLYAASRVLEINATLRAERQANAGPPLSLVHPEHYRAVLKPLGKPGRLLGLLIASLGPAFRRRVARGFRRRDAGTALQNNTKGNTRQR
jgi:SAM-dependent methyltransferase